METRGREATAAFAGGVLPAKRAALKGRTPARTRVVARRGRRASVAAQAMAPTRTRGIRLNINALFPIVHRPHPDGDIHCSPLRPCALAAVLTILAALSGYQWQCCGPQWWSVESPHPSG